MVQLILGNGRISTLAAQQPEVAAVAVRDGRILAAGSNDEILPLRDAQRRPAAFWAQQSGVSRGGAD